VEYGAAAAVGISMSVSAVIKAILIKNITHNELTKVFGFNKQPPGNI
jgi:hypothetical protein